MIKKEVVVLESEQSSEWGASLESSFFNSDYESTLSTDDVNHR